MTKRLQKDSEDVMESNYYGSILTILRSLVEIDQKHCFYNRFSNIQFNYLDVDDLQQNQFCPAHEQNSMKIQFLITLESSFIATLREKASM